MGKTPARNQRAAKGKKAEKKNVCDLCIGPAVTLVGEDDDTDDRADDNVGKGKMFVIVDSDAAVTPASDEAFGIGAASGAETARHNFCKNFARIAKLPYWDIALRKALLLKFYRHGKFLATALASLAASSSSS